MYVIASIAIWSLLAGLVIGLAVFYLFPAELRAKVQIQCLHFGSGGVVFMLVWFLVSTGRALAQVEIALGVIAVTPFIAGLVLWFATKINAR